MRKTKCTMCREPSDEYSMQTVRGKRYCIKCYCKECER